jgi:hypothetical protein
MAVVRVQVVTRGRDTFVKLFRTDNGKLVAVAPVRPEGPSAVEQVIDSSRYFALRVENAAGNTATVGLGLNKREDAFDLKSCLAEQARSVQAEEKGVDLGIEGVSSDLLSGFSAGQKLTLKVGGMGGGGGGSGGARPLAAPGGGAPRALAPPGSAPKALAPPGTKQQQQQHAGGDASDLLGLGGLSLGGAAPAPPAKPAAAAAAAAQAPGEEWVMF